MTNPVVRAARKVARGRDLQRQIDELNDAVDESRRLNERLSDVLDVVVELLVPAVDRNDARLKEALTKLDGVS